MKLIIFDLDGTLIDSLVDITNSINVALEEGGIPQKSPQEVMAMIGNGTKALVERAVNGRPDKFKKAFRTFSQHYEAHLLDNTRFYPGVESMLGKFRSTKIAVMSNKRQRFCDAILKGLNANHYFEIVLGGDQAEAKKPDPAPLLEICRRLDVKTKEAVMVGDSPMDIRAGRAAGMFTVGVTQGFTPAEIMRKTGADHLIPNVATLEPGTFLPAST